jgi:uncharacterized membrane protein
MKKNKYLIIGLIFLILSGTVIYSSKLTVLFFPTQDMELSREMKFEALKKEFLIIQEITVTKEYLTAVELVMVSWGVPYLNENTLMVLDTNYQTLYMKHFINENLYRPKYQLFKFPENIHVGKGGKVILCLSTSTGNKDNHLAVPRMPTGKLGKLSVKPVVNEDVIGTLKGAGQVFPIEGSLCMRTYESSFGFVNWFKTFLFFLASLLTLLIVFAKKLQPFVVQLTFVPEKIYVVLALVFGLALVFITPPLQVPDEHDHLNRAYQLAEFNIFQFDSTVPASLIQLFDTFGGMNFNTIKKTSIDEILSQRKVELNPQVRSAIFARPFIFPYFPQALGMFIGKMFNCSPVMLLYMGRTFNLLFSIGLIYFAIRTAPFFKWIFFLLALMPMTLFLCASLSKDAMIISLSFLLIALLLRFAYDQHKKINIQDLVVLFAISFLVATSRSVYAILIGMFLLIPVYRIGSLKKYIIIFMSLIITVFLATQIGALKPLFQPKAAASTQSTMNLPLSLDALSAPTPTPIERFERSDRINFPKGVNFIEQKQFILNNPIQYLGIVFNSVFISMRTFHLDSFIGIMGWLNKPLPKWHINFYLLILIITAFLLSNNDIKIGLTNKLIILAMFTAGVIYIETGLYLTWNPVGQNYIHDVQGRYFIPCAPLFLLLLYNTSLEKYLKIIFAQRKRKQVKIKRKLFKKPDSVAQNNRQITLYNSYYLLIVCFSVISLLSTVYVVLTGYYVLLI